MDHGGTWGLEAYDGLHDHPSIRHISGTYHSDLRLLHLRPRHNTGSGSDRRLLHNSATIPARSCHSQSYSPAPLSRSGGEPMAGDECFPDGINIWHSNATISHFARPYAERVCVRPEPEERYAGSSSGIAPAPG